MSLSVVATTVFLTTVALAVTGAVRRVPRRSWTALGVRLLRRHRWARRACLAVARRRLRRRHPAIANGLHAVARATRLAS